MSTSSKPLLLLSSMFVMLQTFAQPLKTRDTTIQGPQSFAMILGISKYKYVRPLAYADKDAELFRDYLKSPGGGRVKDENIFCLLNEQAININFWGKGFQWLKAKQLKRGDKLFIYLAGHGDAIDEDQFFFLAYDCNPGSDKNNYLISGAIQLFNLKKKIANETSKGVEVIFIMDACRSQELPGGTEGQNFLNTAISEKKAGEIIMLATGAGQESLEDASIGNGHGLFTYYLVDGLNGLADSIGVPDNKVSFTEIQTYVNKNVPSIALQRFRRKQEPFFCCNENSDRVIGIVDTAYLRNWMRRKRGPGNSFNGIIDPGSRLYELGHQRLAEGDADTLLNQTYERFYSAIRSQKFTGPASAEDYYNQLNTKFPNNPYTLDAQSTFAVELANRAQNKINEYLSCQDFPASERAQIGEIAAGLEKAIPILRQYDEDFAASLSNRLAFLKLSSMNPGDPSTIEFAKNALRSYPNAAYLLNRIATIYLENKNYDSAMHYARKATEIAPKWACAMTTLNLAQQAANSGTNNGNPVKPKNSFGYTLGGGLNMANPSLEENPNATFVGTDGRNSATGNIGLGYFINVSPNVSIRPTLRYEYSNSEVVFSRRPPTGGQTIDSSITMKTSVINLSIPVIIRFGTKSTRPYFMFAVSADYIASQDETSSELLPLNNFNVLGDLGFGVDIPVSKTGLVLSPELKFSYGFLDMNDKNVNTIFTNSLSSLKKQAFTLNLYFHKR